VPLACFIEYLDEVREFDRRCPELRQGEWLLRYFAFDDRRASYEDLPMLPSRAMVWWECLVRNRNQNWRG
jgi:hypothetical protein